MSTICRKMWMARSEVWAGSPKLPALIPVERGLTNGCSVLGCTFGSESTALFQGLSYHDSPEGPHLEMRYLDVTAKSGEKYSILTVNSLVPSPASKEEKRNPHSSSTVTDPIFLADRNASS